MKFTWSVSYLKIVWKPMAATFIMNKHYGICWKMVSFNVTHASSLINCKYCDEYA